MDLALIAYQMSMRHAGTISLLNVIATRAFSTLKTHRQGHEVVLGKYPFVVSMNEEELAEI